MTFTLHVIKGCAYCDAILSLYPSLVKRYPKLYFNMKCDESVNEGTVYHLDVDGVYRDKKDSMLYINDVVDFVERSLNRGK